MHSKRLNISEHHNLFQAFLLASTKDKTTLFDHQNFGFYIFDSDLNLKETFGNQGRGPNEYLYPMDITADENGTFWIIDDGLKRITNISSDGALLDEFNVPFGVLPHRYTSVGAGIFALFSLLSTENFHIVDKKGETITSFLTIEGFSTINQKGLILDGNIAGGDENIYYAGLRNNLLKAYSAEGKLLYSRKTIDPLEPDLLDMDDQELRTSPVTSIGLSVYGNKLLLLSGGRHSDQYRWPLLDVYNKKTGDYLHSYAFEKDIWTNRIAVSNGPEPLWFFIGIDIESRDRILSVYEPPF